MAKYETYAGSEFIKGLHANELPCFRLSSGEHTGILFWASPGSSLHVAETASLRLPKYGYTHVFLVIFSENIKKTARQEEMKYD